MQNIYAQWYSGFENPIAIQKSSETIYIYNPIAIQKSSKTIYIHIYGAYLPQLYITFHAQKKKRVCLVILAPTGQIDWLPWIGSGQRSNWTWDGIQPKSLLDVIGDLIIIAQRPGYKPTFGIPAMTREKKPRTNHWMYQGYRADGNENTYSNLSRVVVRWHTRAKSGLSTKKKKKKRGRMIGWSWSLVERKVDNLQKTCQLEIPRGSHKKMPK